MSPVRFYVHIQTMNLLYQTWQCAARSYYHCHDSMWYQDITCGLNSDINI